MQPTYALNRSVFRCVTSEVTHILDFDADSFYVLNSVAAQLLNRFLEGGEEFAVEGIVTRYQVDAETVRRDLNGLLTELSQQRLLHRIQQVNGFRSRLLKRLTKSRNTLLRAYICRILRSARQASKAHVGKTTSFAQIPNLLFAARLSLKYLGWPETIALWREEQITTDDVPVLDHARIEELDQQIRRYASQQLYFAAACKERALVAWHLLHVWFRRPAEIVVGVERYPFAAHAWVECEGVFVTDDEDACVTYTPVARFG